MPVYLTMWRDGDLSLTAADSLEQAHAHFQTIACLEPHDIVQLDVPSLTLTFTLDQKGDSTFSHYEGAIEEARRICYPKLVEKLDALAPIHPDDSGKAATISKLVDGELKLRRVSPLSKRLARKVPPAPASRPRT